MVKKNPGFALLAPNYLFPEIQKKKLAFSEKYPSKRLISLGIGDTTQPIIPFIAEKISHAAALLSTREGYVGYGPEQGNLKLRKKIGERFYNGRFSPDEIFVSDGAKCDTGRLFQLFGKNLKVAVQDPTYPVYVDTGIISGQGVEIIYMPCTAENDFFPDLSSLPEVDILFFCSPNNPTGQAATKKQLERLVEFALRRQLIVIYDAAYSSFIESKDVPRSIFEIEEAEKVAIEINSFSKFAGFTGIRLGWTVIPKSLRYEDGSSINQAWTRIMTTFFNGASMLAQEGGIAVLEEEGWSGVKKSREYYLENASLLKNAFESLGFNTYGGVDAPFIWVDFSPKKSWEMFDALLEEAQVISVPGSGFGKAGEGYLRFSALGSKEEIVKALERISHYFSEEPSNFGCNHLS